MKTVKGIRGMRIWRRCLAFVLSIIMLSSCVPLSSRAEESSSTGSTVTLTPEVVMLQMYSDAAGTTALEAATTASMQWGWYLRSDVVSVISFDLSDVSVPDGQSVQQAIFQVPGNRTSGGESNTFDVLCLANAVGTDYAVPTVTVSGGDVVQLSADNLLEVAGTTIVKDKTFSTLSSVTNELTLTASIQAAVAEGKDRISFVLIPDANQSTGCDLSKDAAVLTITMGSYTQGAIDTIGQYLAGVYGENLTVLGSKITLPANSAMGISDEYVVTWTQKELSETQVVYTAKVEYGSEVKEQDFTFTLSDTATIGITEYVSLNGKGSIQGCDSSLGMLGRGRVLYMNLDLSNVDSDLRLTNVLLNMTCNGYTTSVTARDLTGRVEVSSAGVSVTDAEVMGSSVPTSYDGWSAISTADVPVVFEPISVGSGNTQIDMTAYIAQAFAAGRKEFTLALYGADYHNFHDISGTLNPTAFSLTVEALDEAKLAQNALEKISAYLTNIYGESLSVLGSNIILPDNSELGLSDEYTVTWQQNSVDDIQVVYTATVGYGENSAAENFTFTLSDMVTLTPEILRVKLYNGHDGTPEATPTASDGSGSWYLRSDYVTFVSFNLKEDTLKCLSDGDGVQEAVFKVTGSRDNAGQGASNTFSVIYLDESIGSGVAVPEVKLTDGTTATLSAENISSVAGTIIVEEKTFSQVKTVTNELDLTESIQSAMAAGDARVTFLLWSNFGQGTGCDQQPDTAGLHLKVGSYTEGALEKISAYLTNIYGESLSVLGSNIILPDNSELGLSDEYTLEWSVKTSDTAKVIYTVTVHYGEEEAEQEFEFILADTTTIKSDILRVKLYSDKTGTTAQTATAEDGNSGIYLRSDYVTFVSFDLDKLHGLLPASKVSEALFTVPGKRDDGGGASNTFSVLRLEDAIETGVKVPTVSLMNGTTESLSAANLSQIAATTILEDQTFLQHSSKINELFLTESIQQAIRNGEERVTFLLVSNAAQDTGCDLNTAVAAMQVTVQEYTDAERCAEAMACIKDRYDGIYTYQNLELATDDVNGATVSWVSEDSNLLSNAGVIGTVSGMKDVVMNVTVASGEAAVTDTITVRVCDENSYWVYTAREYLKNLMGYLQGTEISEDISLLTPYTDKVSVVWTSNKENVIATDGTVTQPAVASPDEEVTLLATITSLADSDACVQYQLEVTVVAKEDVDNAMGTAAKYLEMLQLTYDNSVVVNDYYLPVAMDETDTTTTVVEWSMEENSAYYALGEIDEAGLSVDISSPDEATSVVLRCKISTTGKTNTEYTAVLEADFTVNIVAGQEEAPYGKESLQYLVDFSNKLYQEISGERQVFSTVETSGDNNDIYDIEAYYSTELDCDISEVIAGENFGFLCYPYEYTGDTITSYAKIQIEGMGGADESTPGAVDAEKARSFSIAVANGVALLENQNATATEYSSAIVAIVNAGTEMLQTANLDNTVAVDAVLTAGDEAANRERMLVFSEERQKLMLTVWEAKTTLYQDSKLYLLSDKRALLEQIQKSENALSGTYYFPHNTYREFRTRRDDECLIYCYAHEIRFRNYDNSFYGLEPVLTYYKEQAIIAGSYYEAVIPVSEALTVNEQPATPTSKAETGLVISVNEEGKDRFALMKFDLSALQGDVQFASLQLTSVKNDCNLNDLYLETSDDWSGSTAYDTLLAKYGKDANGALAFCADDYLTSFSPVGKGKSGLISISDAVVKEKVGDGTISLRVQASSATMYPNEYVGMNNTEYDVSAWPLLRVTVGIVDTEGLEAEFSEVLTEHKEFLDSISVSDVGSYGEYSYQSAAAGDYPKDLYDKAVEAYETAQKVKGIYNKAEAVVKLYDAVRILKDNQIMLTDIEPTANLFFTQDDIADLKERINSNEELKSKYEAAKAKSDATSLEVLKTFKEAIFSNDTNKLDELGVLNFTGIGTGSNAKTINTSSMTIVDGASASDVAYAEFVLHLSEGQDYKGNGIANGYFAYIDNLSLKDAASNTIELPNAQFNENADGWRYTGIDTTYASAMDETVVGGSGEWAYTSNTGALYIENTAAESNGAWVSDRFELTAGSYSLTFYIKQHVVFLGDGVTLVLRYYDKDGNYIGYSANQSDNYKSGASYGAWGERFQADALVYAVTGDGDYAEKCILDMIIGANDFAQGTEHWLYNSSRPYGIDAYGAVQGGRFVNCLATAYSLVKDYEGWTEEDRQLLADLCLFIAGDLNDIRDRSVMTPAEAADGTTNWNMDMAIGSAMLGLAFNGMKGWEYGLQYYNNGYITLLGQCTEVNIYGQDGSWNESVRYHNAALSKICVFAKAARNILGDNWFAEDADVQIGKSLFYNVLIQTPSYAISDTRTNISTPAYGDHTLSDGGEFAYLGLYYDEVAKVNPIQAYCLYQTWVKAGTPLPGLSGEANLLESFFAPLVFKESWLTDKGYTLQDAEDAYNSIGSTDTGSMGVDADLNGIVTATENSNVMNYWEELEKAAAAESSNAYKSHGIVVFRNNFNRIGQESYLSMMANEYYVSHNHNDQLGIQLFANSTPLILDVGIGGYWDLSKATYSLSSAHALTQFINANGSECATLNASSNIPAAAQLDFYASDVYDFTSAQTWKSTTHTDGTITRSIGYVKDGFEAYIIWDQVEDEAEDMLAQYNLPIYATETPTVDYENNKVLVKGFNNTNLDVLFLEGNVTENTTSIDTIMLPSNYAVAKRNTTDTAPTVDLLHVRSEAANDDFLTVLFPSTDGNGQELEAKLIAEPTEGVRVYQLLYNDGAQESKVYVMTNATEERAPVSLTGIAGKLIDLKSASLCEVDASSIKIDANSMLVLQEKEIISDVTDSEDEKPEDEKPEDEKPEDEKPEDEKTDDQDTVDDSSINNEASDDQDVTQEDTDSEQTSIWNWVKEKIVGDAAKNEKDANTSDAIQEENVEESEKATSIGPAKQEDGQSNIPETEHTTGKDIKIIAKDNSSVMIYTNSDVIAEGAYMHVVSVNEEQEQYQKVSEISQQSKLSYTQYYVYEIDLYDESGHQLREISDYVEVSLPIPEGVEKDKLKFISVYRLTDENELLECDTIVQDGEIRFSTNHFSTFVIFVKEDNETTTAIYYILALLAVIASLTMLIIYRKKKLHKE